PDPCSRPAGAGQPSAFFLSVTARIHPLLCPLLPSPLCQLVATEISPGKSHILQSIAAASTPLGLLPTSVAVMCLLTHPKEPPYAVPVRQYGPLQSRFLQCRGHPLPPCALLTGFDNSPVRDLHPLDIQRTTLPCGSILGPCWAHTMYIQNRRDSLKLKGCSPLQLSCSLTGKYHAIAYFAYTNRYGSAAKKYAQHRANALKNTTETGL